MARKRAQQAAGKTPEPTSLTEEALKQSTEHVQAVMAEASAAVQRTVATDAETTDAAQVKATQSITDSLQASDAAVQESMEAVAAAMEQSASAVAPSSKPEASGSSKDVLSPTRRAIAGMTNVGPDPDRGADPR